MHSCLSPEITLSLCAKVIFYIFVPLLDKKGFIFFQNALLSFTLFNLKLLWYFFLFFSYNLLQIFSWFSYDRKLSAVLVLKYFVFNWDFFLIAFLWFLLPTELGLTAFSYICMEHVYLKMLRILVQDFRK